MSKTLSISLMIVTFILGISFGYVFSPQYTMDANASKEMPGLGQSDRYLDLRYINQMIAHHRGAILLAEQVLDKSKRPEIQGLAKEILANEPKLIAQLYSFKKDWYKDSRKVKDNYVPNLGEYDENLDLRFLNALIAHHELGVEMADETKLKSSRNEILNDANAVGEFLSNGVIMLKEWRKNWYNI